MTKNYPRIDHDPLIKTQLEYDPHLPMQRRTFTLFYTRKNGLFHPSTTWCILTCGSNIHGRRKH